MNSSTSISSEDEGFNIILHAYGKLFNIPVKPLDPINLIFDKINGAEDMRSLTLMYNNSILIQALSFAFYGITHESHLYGFHDKPKVVSLEPIEYRKPINAFSSNNHEYLTKLYKKFKQSQGDDYHSFPDDQYLSIEKSKMKDRIFKKVEGTIRCHRKMIRNFIDSANSPSLLNSIEFQYNHFNDST